MEYVIRPMCPEEYSLLKDFLYLAIYQPEGERLPKDIIYGPALYGYIQNFGTQQHDHCLCATADGCIIGAIWVRAVHGYGYVGEKVPELAISLYPEYRGRGMGTQLLRGMLGVLREEGYAKVSLSVQKENRAWHMYQREGFQTISQTEQEYVMECPLGREEERRKG